jgi:hypothetical protein
MADNIIHDKDQLTKLINLINGGYMKQDDLDLRHMDGEKLNEFREFLKSCSPKEINMLTKIAINAD